MANQIKIKRGLESARSGLTPAEGELIYTTDEKKVYVGDGTTAGGNAVGGDVSNGDASLNLGVEDTTAGVVNIYGNSTTTGGALYLYNGVTDEVPEDYWKLSAEADFVVYGEATARLRISESTGWTYLTGNLTVEPATGAAQITVGDVSTQEGSLIVAGDNATTGGKIRINNGATVDTNVGYWEIIGNTSGDLQVSVSGGVNNGSIIFTVDEDTLLTTFTQDVVVPTETYGASWNGSNEVPTKDAVYDKIETLGSGTSTGKAIALNLILG